MSDSDWIESEPMRALIHDLVEQAVRSYRIQPPDAERMIRESLAGCGPLRKAAETANSLAELRRTRACKQAMTEAKRKIYYHLRAYKSEQGRFEELGEALRALPPGRDVESGNELVGEILAAHASTRERIAQRAAFYDRLLAVVPTCRSVVDLGCGVHPLMFPFADPRAADLEGYVALDSDPLAVRCVQAYGRWRRLDQLVAAHWNLAEGWAPVRQVAGRDSFDLALMMKLVPVVARQRRDLLPVLAETPASRWLLTGSCLALTRQASIERRERRVLRDFVELSGRVVEQEFTVGEEFALLVV